MAGTNLISLPRPGELWLSRPPYLMMARVVAVDAAAAPAVVSYELFDEDGWVLESVEHAQVDAAWWRTFQRLQPRFG